MAWLCTDVHGLHDLGRDGVADNDKAAVLTRNLSDTPLGTELWWELRVYLPVEELALLVVGQDTPRVRGGD